MHGVVETPAYLRQAKAEGMRPEEMAQAVNQVAEAPEDGDVIQGSGGCRKIRVAGKSKGKSGGYRIVTLFGGRDVPVFMLAVLAKGSAANFTDSQVAAMKTVAQSIAAAYRKGMAEMIRAREMR